MSKKTKNFFPADTVKKLRKLQRYILAEPKRIHMDDWGIHVDPKDKTTLKNLKENYGAAVGGDLLSTLLVKNPPCGTMACAAGNLCIIGGLINPQAELRDSGEPYYYFDSNTPELAAEYLGIDEEVAGRLFYFKGWASEDNGWPKEFEDRLNKHNPGTLGYAKVVVARIEHFIKTGE